MLREAVAGLDLREARGVCTGCGSPARPRQPSQLHFQDVSLQ